MKSCTLHAGPRARFFLVDSNLMIPIWLVVPGQIGTGRSCTI